MLVYSVIYSPLAKDPYIYIARYSSVGGRRYYSSGFRAYGKRVSLPFRINAPIIVEPIIRTYEVSVTRINLLTSYID